MCIRDRLDDAKEAIDDIKHNQRNMIKSDLYQCMWTGSNAQECYDSCESGNLYTAYDGYVSNKMCIRDRQMDRVSEGVILHSFDLDELESERKSWGLFRDRRPEMYGEN